MALAVRGWPGSLRRCSPPVRLQVDEEGKVMRAVSSTADPNARPDAVRAFMHRLPRLPYEPGALAPVISAATVELHYGKHHKGYVDNLNRLIETSEYRDWPLEKIIVESARRPGALAIYNNAAQAWNHAFYWRSLRPGGGGVPRAFLRHRIEASFGSVDECLKQLSAAAVSQFGSGWAWLCLRGGRIEILKTGNADGPLTQGLRPLLVIDVWEHAYYLDYQNRRLEHVEAVLHKLIDWGFAAENLG
jgi:Fe-Mn family superoxide dismutase